MIVSCTGETLAMGSHKLRSHRDGPRHEQDPEEWWEAVLAACRAALSSLPGGFTIGGVAVDGTSGTILLVDRDGRPLTPALMYDDARAVEEVKRVNEAGAAVWAVLGYNRMQAAWGLPKLLWLLDRYRGLPAGTRFAHQTDFINRRLVGDEVATDTSNALKSGIDLINDRWPNQVFDALGIPGEIFPAVVRSGTVLGVVGTEAAHSKGYARYRRNDRWLCRPDRFGSITGGSLELRAWYHTRPQRCDAGLDQGSLRGSVFPSLTGRRLAPRRRFERWRWSDLEAFPRTRPRKTRSAGR